MIETPQAFLNKYQGQSLLFNTADPSLRGECVQSVCFFVSENGFPVIWADAAEWWNHRNNRYEYIANTPDAVPQPGDIIIWSSALPGSGGAGHEAVCLYPLPGTGTFVSVDQNWGGKTVHAVTHNYSYVLGWMRMKQDAPAPAPAPQPAAVQPTQTQENEMIVNADQATKIYKMLRPNGNPSQAEIDSTVNHRSFAQFVNDAQNEVNQRDANLRSQADQLANISNQINAQNQTITELRNTIQSSEVSNSDKQKALDEALTKVAQQNAELTTLHDQIAQLQTALPTATPDAPSADPTDPKAKFSLSSLNPFITAFKLYLTAKNKVSKS